MVRRRPVVLFSVLALLALVASAVIMFGWIYQNPPGINEANFRRLHKGMTPTQVEAVLGSKGVAVDTALVPGSEWRNGQTQIEVFYNKGVAFMGELTGPGDEWIVLADEPESILEMGKRWLKEWTGW
jgi:hypothetical protein